MCGQLWYLACGTTERWILLRKRDTTRWLLLPLLHEKLQTAVRSTNAGQRWQRPGQVRRRGAHGKRQTLERIQRGEQCAIGLLGRLVDLDRWHVALARRTSRRASADVGSWAGFGGSQWPSIAGSRITTDYCLIYAGELIEVTMILLLLNAAIAVKGNTGRGWCLGDTSDPNCAVTQKGERSQGNSKIKRNIQSMLLLLRLIEASRQIIQPLDRLFRRYICSS